MMESYSRRARRELCETGKDAPGSGRARLLFVVENLFLLHVTDDGNMQLVELLLSVPTKWRGIVWGPLAGYIIRSRK